MSKYLALFFCLVVTIFSCKDYDEIPCVPNGLKENVRAFYSFNKGSLNDKSIEGNDLTMHGLPIPTHDRKGNIDCGYLFNRNTDDYLTAGGDFLKDFHTKEFSIALWFYGHPRDVSNKYSAYELLLGRVNEFELECPSKYGEWSLGLYDCRKPIGSVNKNSIWYDLTEFYSGQQNKCDLVIDDLTEKWIHIVFTFDNDDLTIYIDGKLLLNSEDNGCGSNSTNLGDLVIGKFFSGVIDDVIIFNKELSTSEVAQLYELEPCCE